MNQLNENLGILETLNLAKNPNIGENVELMAHGYWLMLTIKNHSHADYKYEVLDIKGNTLKLDKIQMQCEIIDCQNLQPNVYLLNIYRNSKIIIAYRIVILDKENFENYNN